MSLELAIGWGFRYPGEERKSTQREAWENQSVGNLGAGVVGNLVLLFKGHPHVHFWNMNDTVDRGVEV